MERVEYLERALVVRGIGIRRRGRIAVLVRRGDGCRVGVILSPGAGEPAVLLLVIVVCAVMHIVSSRLRPRNFGWRKSFVLCWIPIVSVVSTRLALSIVFITGVMCPNLEAPGFVTHKIRVPIGDAHVVKRLLLTRIVHLLDTKPTTHGAREQVARLEFGGDKPTLAARVERMLRGRPDDFAFDVQMPNGAEMEEEFFHALPRQRPLEFVFIPRQNLIANENRVDALIAFAPIAAYQQLRLRGEAGAIWNCPGTRWSDALPRTAPPAATW